MPGTVSKIDSPGTQELYKTALPANITVDFILKKTNQAIFTLQELRDLGLSCDR